MTLDEELAPVIAEILARVWKQNGYDVTKTAEVLGLSRKQFYNLRKKHNVQKPEDTAESA